MGASGGAAGKCQQKIRRGIIKEGVRGVNTSQIYQYLVKKKENKRNKNQSGEWTSGLKERTYSVKVSKKQSTSAGFNWG